MQSVGKRILRLPSRFLEKDEPSHFQSRSRKHTSRDRAINIIEVQCTDVLFDGSPFECANCKTSCYNPAAHRKSSRFPKSRVVHPKTVQLSDRKTVHLCLMCEKLARIKKGNTTVIEDKETAAPVESASAIRLEAFLKDAYAASHEILVCAVSKRGSSPCDCTCDYLVENGQLKTECVENLIKIHSTATDLKAKPSSLPRPGSGRKLCEEFESYINEKRHIMKNQYKLCERMCQKILKYSNNYIHKPLRSEQLRARQDKLEKYLTPLAHLVKEKCCSDKCVALSKTHLNLVSGWREMALTSRNQLNQAIAEMLIPSAGCKTNCYKFIRLVTGCSSATIANMVDRVRRNGGIIGPAEHGLKKYWRDKKKKRTESCSPIRKSSVYNSSKSNLALEENIIAMEKVIQDQKRELSHMKAQLTAVQTPLTMSQRPTQQRANTAMNLSLTPNYTPSMTVGSLIPALDTSVAVSQSPNLTTMLPYLAYGSSTSQDPKTLNVTPIHSQSGEQERFQNIHLHRLQSGLRYMHGPGISPTNSTNPSAERVNDTSNSYVIASPHSSQYGDRGNQSNTGYRPGFQLYHNPYALYQGNDGRPHSSGYR